MSIDCGCVCGIMEMVTYGVTAGLVWSMLACPICRAPSAPICARCDSQRNRGDLSRPISIDCDSCDSQQKCPARSF